MQKYNIKRETLIKWLLALIILFIGSINIFKLHGLTIGVDDFGYMSMAAYFRGYDWGDLTVKLPYYSYIYSFLLLPLFFIFENAIDIYRCVIILNVMMQVAAYLLSIICFKKIFVNMKENVIIALCFVSSLYTSFFIYSQYILTESLIYLFFWIISFVLIKYIEKPNNKKLVFIFSLNILLFFIHQRTLTMLLSFILIFFFINIKKINIKFFLIAFLMLILFFIGNEIKSFVINNIYYDNSAIGVNNFSGQVGKLKYFFSSEGITDFFKGLFSKSYYFLFSTLFIGGFGLTHLIAQLITTFKKNNNILDFFVSTNILYSYWLLSFLSSFLLQAFSLIRPIRYDQVIYGRYVEFLFAPLIFLGIYRILYLKNKIIKEICIYLVIGLIGAIMAISLFTKYNLKIQTSYLAPALFPFFNNNIELKEGTYLSVFWISCLVIIFIVILTKANEIKNKKILFVLCLIPCVFWLYSTYSVNKYIIKDHKILLNEYYPIKDIVYQKNKKICFLLDKMDLDEKRLRELQFILMDTPLERMTEDLLDSNIDAYLVLLSKSSNIYKKINELEEIEILFENNRYILIHGTQLISSIL